MQGRCAALLSCNLRRSPALAGTESTNAMHNLLLDPLIRVRATSNGVTRVSLPDLYVEMVQDRVTAFPALRPHQRHAWHAFLCQLGVIALHRAGLVEIPESPQQWRSLLRATTSEFADDQPWHLIVDDPGQPAFMQCPAPAGLDDYRRSKATPDDLDILLTAKNHEIKQATAEAADPEDWIYALIDLQTMSGFLGAGNYQIARMNGGYSSRPCLGLAPSGGGPGAHLCCDIRRMLSGRDALLAEYPDYFRKDPGVGLVWLEPWDGTGSLDLRDLDPYFIEICRRVRLTSSERGIAARTAASRATRIYAKMAGGDTGDFWTPVRTKDGKALSLSSAGFRYDRLAELVLDRKAYRRPPAMQVSAEKGARWQLVARGIAAGQGKTEGYHERTDIAFTTATARALSRQAGLDALAEISSAQIEEVQEVIRALRFGIAVAAGGGRDASELSKSHRTHAGPYSRRLDAEADARFFPALEERYVASTSADADAVAACRAAFARSLIRDAEHLLDEAIESVPCPAIHRPRSRARAASAFWGRLRGAKSVFSDQPEIFTAREVDHAA